ncbi:hypothetical protein TSUD_08350 [Trifolium subterraneum]|nr:hypothetical protein TSUD_08350 [Trifolium subterraneum]
MAVGGRNLSSPASSNVNYDAPPIQPTLPPPQSGRNLPSPSCPNVNCDAPPIQPTLPPLPPNINFDASPDQSNLPPPSSNVFDWENLKYILYGIGTVFVLAVIAYIFYRS